jgi:hypothetical protein
MLSDIPDKTDDTEFFAIVGFQIFDPTNHQIVGGEKFDLSTDDVIEICAGRAMVPAKPKEPSALQAAHAARAAFSNVDNPVVQTTSAPGNPSEDFISRQRLCSQTEQKARRMAKRLGLMAFTSRRQTTDNHGGFLIFDPTFNLVLAGEKFDLTTDDVVEFCQSYERPLSS